MDSLSQIALGAAVSVAVFRRKQPLWRSALLGAVVGTLPDLDVFLAYDDPISDMTYHRTEPTRCSFCLKPVGLVVSTSRTAGS